MDLDERTGLQNFNSVQLKSARLPSMNGLLNHISLAPADTSEQNACQNLLFRHFSTTFVPIAYFSEVIHPRNPRTELFNETKRKKIDDLISRGTFRIVLRSEDEKSLKFIPSRYVLTIKNDENGEEL